MQPGGDTSRGLNPTDVSALDGTLGGTPYTHFAIYIRLYKTGNFGGEDNIKETIYNTLESVESFGINNCTSSYPCYL